MAEFQIQPETPSLAERRAQKRQQQRTRLVVAGAVAACLVVVALIVVSSLSRPGEPPSGPDPAAAPRPTPSTERSTRDGTGPAAVEPVLVEDDGQTMWVSPTAGSPVSLAWLPPGCEMIVSLRPADLLASDEGAKVLAALGPLGRRGVRQVEATTGLPVEDIEHLVIGFRPGANYQPQIVWVVTPRQGVTIPERAGMFRPQANPSLLVFADRETMEEVQRLDGTTPPLQRELETLVADSDADRHVWVFVTRTYLFDDGRRMWHGTFDALRDGLFELLPDHTRAVALSMHWNDDFFSELRVAATVDQSPHVLARQLADRVATWSMEVERVIAGVATSPYGRTIVARLPAMLRVLQRYQRHGVDGNQALLRVYLPAAAGHNLLMAGELLLAERAASVGSVATPAAGPAPPLTLDERLARPISLSFARDTLETALALLAEEVGVEIVIRGNDLQLEGITKNQSFALDEQNRPAREILLSILRLANPDKSATDLADPNQKLVYTVGRQEETGEAVIYITTRSQASRRGERLPEVFTP